MVFAERLKMILKQRGMTEYRLAKLAGMQRSTINSLTKGDRANPLKNTLEKLSKALDISVSELIGEDEELAEEIQEKPIDEWTLIIKKAKEHHISPERIEKLVDFLIEDK